MNKFLQIGTIILIIIGSISCNKFLDKKVNTAISTPSSLTALQSLMDNANIINVSTTPAFGEASADDYFVKDSALNAAGERLSGIYTWNPIPYQYNNDWAKGYTTVYYANLCLEALETIAKTDEAQWDAIKGAALFLRAYSFLNLVWTFGKAWDEQTAETDLGIDLRLQTDFNVPSKRSSIAATYNSILKDAKESLQYLHDQSAHVFRPSKAAAYGLLARTYLSMRIYDSALYYANACLQLRNALIDYNTITNNNTPFATKAYNGETIFYSSMMYSAGAELIGPGSGPGCMDTLLYKSYADGDLRKILFFRPYTGYYIFKGSYTTSGSELFTGIATDEMYLVRAECNARAGNIQTALEDLNTLLKARWSNKQIFEPLTAQSAEEAINLVLQERRRQLLMRGLRWIDIKRLNKEGRNIMLMRMVNNKQVTLPPNDKRYALPLPEDIIKITGVEQN